MTRPDVAALADACLGLDLNCPWQPSWRKVYEHLGDLKAMRQAAPIECQKLLRSPTSCDCLTPAGAGAKKGLIGKPCPNNPLADPKQKAFLALLEEWPAYSRRIGNHIDSVILGIKPDPSRISREEFDLYKEVHAAVKPKLGDDLPSLLMLLLGKK